MPHALVSRRPKLRSGSAASAIVPLALLALAGAHLLGCASGPVTPPGPPPAPPPAPPSAPPSAPAPAPESAPPPPRAEALADFERRALSQLATDLLATPAIAEARFRVPVTVVARRGAGDSAELASRVAEALLAEPALAARVRVVTAGTPEADAARRAAEGQTGDATLPGGQNALRTRGPAPGAELALLLTVEASGDPGGESAGGAALVARAEHLQSGSTVLAKSYGPRSGR